MLDWMTMLEERVWPDLHMLSFYWLARAPPSAQVRFTESDLTLSPALLLSAWTYGSSASSPTGRAKCASSWVDGCGGCLSAMLTAGMPCA
eukprot:5110960-Amphidinium_carterae.4